MAPDDTAVSEAPPGGERSVRRPRTDLPPDGAPARKERVRDVLRRFPG